MSETKLASLEAAIERRMPMPAWGRFPSAEIRSICKIDYEELYFAFDSHFADVAGYTVNVRKIQGMPASELIRIRLRIEQPFFERYRKFKIYRDMITPGTTPELHRQLHAVEENRADLVMLVDTVIEFKQGESGTAES